MTDSLDHDWLELKRRFQQLSEQSAEQQEQELAELEHGDAAMASRLRELLDHDARSGGMLETGALHGDVTAPDETHPGEQLGAYRIVRRLAEGGMGSVWLAERDDGSFEKQVAIKLIRSDRADPAARARFASERQLLAGLDHPHVARLLDGGVTDDDRLFLVMEYVEGVDLLSHCDQQRLGIPERVRLFLQVIEAVQHAHRHLIIHRDLKPSNILVTPAGTPKLLDFGIARIQSDAAETASTADRLLTPDYASPEQLQGEAVTTTSDVYSLGVILYELLCGQPPYRIDRSSDTPLEQVVREHTIVAPSEVARSATDPQAAMQRGRTPALLAHALSGDLDAIVLHCLQKDANQRYSSAQQLAEDLQRSLDGWPVRARPASWTDRLHKFVRRNPRLVGSLAAIVLVSITAAGISYQFAMQTQHALAEAETNRQAAIRAQATAERELIRSEGVRRFLTRVLNKAHPRIVPAGQQISLREALDLAADEIADSFADDPETRAAVHSEVFQMYSEFGEFEKALVHVREARALLDDSLGDADWQSLDAAAAEALVLVRLRRLEEAESILRQAWNLAAGREHQQEPTARMARNAILNALGYVTTQQARAEEGQQWFRQAIAAVEDKQGLTPEQIWEAHQRMAASWSNAGMALAATDRSGALEVLRHCIEFRERELPEDVVSISEVLHNIGHLEGTLGDFQAAERAYRQALTGFRETYSDEHWQALASLRGLGGALIRQGRFLEGLPRAAHSVEQAGRVSNSPISLPVWTRELASFRRHVNEAVGNLETQLTADASENRLALLLDLADANAALGNTEAALDTLDEAREIALFQDPVDAIALSRIIRATVFTLIDAGDPESALARLEEDLMEWPESPDAASTQQKLLCDLVPLLHDAGHQEASLELSGVAEDLTAN